MKILLIQLKQIGDVLITTSLLKNIKENFPNSKVDMLVYDYCEGVVRNNPYIDKIITVSSEERTNSLKFYSKMYKLRKEKYDYSIDLLADVRSAIVTFFVAAKNRVVSKKNKLRNQIFYNKRIENRNSNVVMYRNYLLKAIKEDIKFDSEVKIYIENSEKDRLKERMKSNGVDFSKPVAAFGINSRRIFKVWDLEYFIEMINYMIEKYDMQIILYNNKEEKEYAERAKSKIKNKNSVFTEIYTENIRELAALLSNCDIFIGNEGGPRHIAESVDIPTFTIAYTTHNREDWILNEKTWKKTNRMVQIDDYLKINEVEFNEYKKFIGRNREIEIVEFKKLKPDFVIKCVKNMIEELKEEGIMRKEIEWKK